MERVLLELIENAFLNYIVLYIPPQLLLSPFAAL
jgi:hypothetical protein